jgi:hypothetical protein
MFPAQLGALVASENAGPYLTVIARSTSDTAIARSASDAAIARSASDEAIHSLVRGDMDCFASLAMTN